MHLNMYVEDKIGKEGIEMPLFTVTVLIYLHTQCRLKNGILRFSLLCTSLGCGAVHV